MPSMEFGQEVRRRRIALQMSLEDLATASRLTPGYIGTIENGKRDPSLSTVMALAKGLRISVGELMGNRDFSGPASEAAALIERMPAELQYHLLDLLRAVYKTTLVMHGDSIPSVEMATGTDGLLGIVGSRHSSVINFKHLPKMNPWDTEEDRAQIRERFRNELSDRLQSEGFLLAASTLGRISGNAFAWDITLEDGSGGLYSYQVRLQPGIPPYSAAAMAELIRQTSRSSTPTRSSAL